MIALKRTAEFDKWLKGLDVRTRARILVRLDRLRNGNPGDVAPVGDGISEMRLHAGPGHRLYYKQDGDAATLFYGGDKATQRSDIAKAKQIARNLED